MPTIEIDVPEGRPYEAVERVRRERGISYLAMLLHGADALTVPQGDDQAVEDHDCQWGDCTEPADMGVWRAEAPDDPDYYCVDCAARVAARRRMNGER